jgi:tetratricopeptide (TPR) repeat protein
MKVVNRTTERRIGLAWHIQCCLRWIDSADMFGIDVLNLEDEIGPATIHSPEWHNRSHKEDLNVNGQYFAKQGQLPATITLYIRTLYCGIPKIYWLSPVITLQVARTLAPEIGHHLIAERGYVFEKNERIDESEYREEMANRYSFSVTKRMQTRWYYRLAAWLTRDLAGSYYQHGILEWQAGRYERAASSWKKAFDLDPNQMEAAYWYQRAKQTQSRDSVQ